MEAFYSPAELAAELGLSVQTLAHWRTLGRGPEFVKVGGRVRYRGSAVKRYLDARTFDRTPAPTARRAAS